MAVTPNSIVTPQSFGNGTPQTFVNADGTAKKDLVTAGANGALVTGLFGTTNDTAANNVALYVNDGVTDFLIGTVRLATLSGTDGAVNGVSLLNQTALPALKLDAAGNLYLTLQANYKLRAAVLVAVTAAKTLSLTPVAENF